MYALLAACTATSAVFGYRMLLRLSRALSTGLTVLLVIGVVAYAGDFSTAAPAGTQYLLGGFWPTWLLAAVSARLSGPIAFITLLGDYTRYISPRRFSQPRVLRAGWSGLVAGLLAPQLFGTFTALAVGAGEDYAGPLVAAAPRGTWCRCRSTPRPAPVGNAGLMLHSMGLGPGRDPAAGDAHAGDLRGRRGLHAAAHRRGHPVGGDHPHRVRPGTGTLRRRRPQVCNRRARGGLYWCRGGGNVRAAVA